MNRLAELSNCEPRRLTDFVKKYGARYDPLHDDYQREPFASDVKAGKNTAVYNTHSYHTKVPPEGIRPFIRHYTNIGDLILDPFAGSGMTGVAALAEKRIPILIDLSPGAASISYNYCSSIDAGQFLSEVKKIINATKTAADWLYQTKCQKCGKSSIINHIIWTDEFACPRCEYCFLLFDVAMKDGKVLKEFRCPNCGKDLNKAKCKKTNSKPIKVNYSCSRCGRIESRVVTFDYEKVKEIERRWEQVQELGLYPETDDGTWPMDLDKALWYPKNPMMNKGEKWGDTWRAGVHKNITRVDHFFTIRNMWMLALLWSHVARVRNPDIRNKLQWTFTSIVEGSSRLNRERSSGLPSKLSGTLYVSSFYREINVWKFFERKANKIASVLGREPLPFIVATQSATDLSNILSNSIDYVFTDPPFGGNLMYSELNFLWESWFGVFTDTTNEAIINNSQGKGIIEYKDLMTRAFKEIYRVLKPGRWMTMVFHNSDGEVWQAIQDGLSEAGFVVGMIGTFDKKQRSFKQATSSGAVGYDVVIDCYKPKATVKNGLNGKTTDSAIIGFLADQLLKASLEIGEDRTARKLHSKTIGFFMLQNKPLRNLSFEEFQKILRMNFREIDGYWYLPYQRPALKGQKRLFGYVSTEGEAIEWLESFLIKPKKYGEIAPEFFKALGQNKLQKSLQDLLRDNFVEEKDTWRNPTKAERETLFKKLTDKTARQIDSFLKGQTEEKPSDDTLCEWVEFCYTNGLFKEGAALFHYIDEKGVSSETFQKTKKIAEICKLKSWEGS